MVGLSLLREIEDLLLDKLDRQESCLKFYEQVDDTIKHDLLSKIFEQIDRLEHDIQSMDISFLSKLEKFKSLNSVDDINDIKHIAEIETLQIDEKQSLKLIKKAVMLITEREKMLDTAKKDTQEIRQNTEIKVKQTTRENKAYSAYRNINK